MATTNLRKAFCMSLFAEGRLSSCEICAKPSSSGHNLKMHMGKGLTNADIEEIVTKFHLKTYNVIMQFLVQTI